ncbi:hypothetical protein GUITHDRAFT_147713 [Guillardia theta CCMP2712]|uniref:Right handed beta helix domain-containing protein n=1 Tax=Guillardia theta (strain CCMP2712) TaxID=905079 RepID=L1IBS8_GUITC|nr:hypothetical protein GUITHDRAFT_147713 [Guillardia theta CCMP2712]EKX33693.1 hypothetical protein GUITHDRAFT_147713 [Guillardia theta CCMP2712]|eukprot:XP_005820673.1 hypothetical protein GUITHDRAFT_147713 [Guillardia theta CCMP2712]
MVVFHNYLGAVEMHIRSSIIKLRLDNNRLERISDGIRYCTNLRELNLSSNRLSDLPETISFLTNLTQIQLNSNKFDHLPESIAFCFNLRKLIRNPNLFFLPIELGYCTQLSMLEVDDIVNFPSPETSACYLSSHELEIGGLLRLEHLHLDNNSLRSLPSSLGNITTIRVLNLRCNDLGLSISEDFSRTNSLETNVSQPPISYDDASFPLPVSMRRLKVANPKTCGPFILKILFLTQILICISLLRTYSRIAGAQAVVKYLEGVNQVREGSSIDVSEAGLNYFPRFVIDWRLVRKGAAKEGDAETGGSSEDILLLLNLDGNNLRALPEADCGQYTASVRPAGQKQKSDASGSPSLISSVKPSNSNKVAHKEGLFSHREGFGFVLQTIAGGMRALETVRHLSAAGNKLVSVPPSLSCLTLELLRLSSNFLVSLPREIFKMKSLRELSLNNNDLAELPTSISLMPALLQLSLRDNRQVAEKFPAGLLQQSLNNVKLYLRRIEQAGQQLDLSGLMLQALPSILRIGIAHTLRELVLADNQLSDLPLDLSALHSLETLDLRQNRFLRIPDVVFSLLVLKVLNLQDNPLQNLPEEILHAGSDAIFSYSRRVRASHRSGLLDLRQLGLSSLPRQIFSLSHVEDLDLSENSIRSLPDQLCWLLPNLTRLSLRKNELQAPLPLFLGLLSALTSLDLAQNKLSSLPLAIAQLTRLKTLGHAGNPLRMPTAAALASGLPNVFKLFGQLVAKGVGMSQTRHVRLEEGMQSLDRLSLAPYAKPEHHECVLIQQGRRRGCSLEDAVQEAQAGAMILLRPGRYRQPLLLQTDGVTVAGDGGCEECVICFGKEHPKENPGGEEGTSSVFSTIISKGSGICLYNLTVEWDGADSVMFPHGVAQDSAAVLVLRGDLALVNCVVHNPRGAGVILRRAAKAKISACRFASSGTTGIVIEEEVSAEVRFCDILKSKKCAILYMRASNPLIEGNRIVHSGSSGILAACSSLGIIKSNDIVASKRAGVELQDGSDPVVQQNKIYQNMFGLILSASRGKILDNVINESKFAAVSILKKTCTELTLNRIKGEQKATGMMVSGGSKVWIRQQELQGVRKGIVISEASEVSLYDSRIFHLSSDAVAISGEDLIGLVGCSLDSLDNKINFNNGVGLLVDEDCTGSMARNEVIIPLLFSLK